MLCIVLAVAFAGASAASVVDKVQHAAQVEHEHGFPIAFHAGAHGHAEAHGDHHPGGEPDRSEPDMGAGHHQHADAPLGALAAEASAAPAAPARSAQPARIEIAGPKGVRPGGLERPPRPLAILV